MTESETELLCKIRDEFVKHINSTEFENGQEFSVVIEGKEVCVCRKPSRGFTGLFRKIWSLVRN